MQRLLFKSFASSPRRIRWRGALLLGFVSLLATYLATISFARELRLEYDSLRPTAWRDRNGTLFSLSPRPSGIASSAVNGVPERFGQLLLKKEDRYFYYHPGINPVSKVRSLIGRLKNGSMVGGSTITEQLVKVLLRNENDRTIKNKLVELFYVLALELHASKREILTMYEHSAYFGNNQRGVAEAALHFFGKQTSDITEPEMLQLIAALGSPSLRFPGSARNAALLPLVAAATESDIAYIASSSPFFLSRMLPSPKRFELKTFNLACGPCDLTIDAALTEKIRDVLLRRISAMAQANAHNGAVVVIKIPENELLAIVGSPNPRSTERGSQINMAVKPRPIGSIAKPFIYLNAFMKGARPYTLVDDREYSYRIGTGFAFYPKNFDGTFRGAVTLHSALSNSLNVPAVKTLEYVGLSRFYDFLEDALGFTPLAPLPNYELGIALGALEMDLLTLSHFFTIFPTEGILRPLTLEKSRVEGFRAPMEKEFSGDKRVAPAPFVQLVNKILSDRETAVDQFGLRSALTLPYKNYALKTGTSRDYHDSWTIGFTPDFLVGVWLGNSDNTPMRELTGQGGAGAVFEDVMTLLYASEYNRNTPLSFDKLAEFTESGGIEYGLPGDDYDTARALLLQAALILSPHDGDVIMLSNDAIIPLKSKESVDWFVDGVFLARGQEIGLRAKRTGKMRIEAVNGAQTESITVSIIPAN